MRGLGYPRPYYGWVIAGLVLLLGACSPEVHFSPHGEAAQAIVDRIDAARQSIDVAMYTLTNSDLAWAMVHAQSRGVRLRVLVDAGYSEGCYSKVAFLRTWGVEVRVDGTHANGEGGIMHHKFCVIDAGTVITGSYNWTASAEERNDENLLIFTRSPRLASAYRREFERLWDQAVSTTPDGASVPRELPPTLSATDLDGLRSHAGRDAFVRGRVHRVHHSERSDTYFIDFGPTRDSFTAVIFASAASTFRERGPDVLSIKGHVVQISGKIIDHQKYGLEMILEDPHQMEILE
jgi:phosphatidylserine/phosphatidylglycerophosphate/cardiolipin synthase-like enzyme